MAANSNSSYRVYIEDTDMMGIVYHARYLYFFERARTDLLRNNGISLTTMATYDTYFAIHDLHIHYHLPARLDDMLTIQTSVEEVKACTLLMKQIMHNQAGLLLSDASMRIVTVDKQLKPKRLSKEIIGGIKHG